MTKHEDHHKPLPTPQEYAVALAKCGFAVFPVRSQDHGPRKAKTPLTANGFKDASRDPEQIRRWWTEHPNALIGYATGAASRAIVVDIDCKNGGLGYESLEKLQEKSGRLPATLTISTPSGGQHRVYRVAKHVNVRNSVNRLGPGIDVRGNGGYAIMPPSTIYAPDGSVLGSYEMASEDPIVEAPAWLIDLLTADAASTKSSKSKDQTDDLKAPWCTDDDWATVAL
jgi:hypothetical protein